MRQKVVWIIESGTKHVHNVPHQARSKVHTVQRQDAKANFNTFTQVNRKREHFFWGPRAKLGQRCWRLNELCSNRTFRSKMTRRWRWNSWKLWCWTNAEKTVVISDGRIGAPRLEDRLLRSKKSKAGTTSTAHIHTHAVQWSWPPHWISLATILALSVWMIKSTEAAAFI